MRLGSVPPTGRGARARHTQNPFLAAGLVLARRSGSFRQKSCGWFVAVLILQLIGLGIIGMVLYGIWGPADSSMGVVTRPTTAG